MVRKVVHTDGAPKAVGPYSQGICAGDYVFTSGQVGLDPGTGKMVEGGTTAQARQIMENIRAVLEAANSDFSKVVKVTVYLSDIKDFTAFNAVYSEYFPADPPARSAFQVAALPLGARVEIEMVALVG
jgi:2-iminobutanoate/2-iminopropanoate deaminase